MAFNTFWPENNFSAILVSNTDLLNLKFHVPLSFSHDSIPNNLNKITIATRKPQWVQVLHSENMMNSVFPWSEKVDTISLNRLLYLNHLKI